MTCSLTSGYTLWLAASGIALYALDMFLDRNGEFRVIREPGRAPSSLLMLLRYFRTRIDPKIRALGPHERLPSRCGKPVTQEELAEYLGVSRTWYGLLESKRPARVSIVLLDRLSVALMLTREERAKLFALALPELDFFLKRSAISPGAGARGPSAARGGRAKAVAEPARIR